MTLPYELNLGCCLEELDLMLDNSVDAIVTDPPYGLGKEPDAFKMLQDWLETGHHEVKGRGFMGKEWDAFVPQPQVWRECLRVLKPGGHLLAFAGTRTQDLMTLGLRLAGFEIRDMVAWVYGSGFPKSLDVSKALDKMAGSIGENILDLKREIRRRYEDAGMTLKQFNEACGFEASGYLRETSTWASVLPPAEKWAQIKRVIECDGELDALFTEAEREVTGYQKRGNSLNTDFMSGGNDITTPATDAAKQWDGWGTALKPALEPITLARKPLEGTVAANVLKWHTGALNIDGCRVAVPAADKENYDKNMACHERYADGREKLGGYEGGWNADPSAVKNTGARWPANLIHDGSDEVVELFPNTKSGTISPHHQRNTEGGNGNTHGKMVGVLGTSSGDSGSASRFFYQAKTSKTDRNEGCEDLQDSYMAAPNQAQAQLKRGVIHEADSGVNTVKVSKNNHPTVKPTDLMRYLCRLITPPGGVILDPYMGSGSTGKAALLEGFQFIGIERDDAYFAICKERIAAAYQQSLTTQPNA